MSSSRTRNYFLGSTLQLLRLVYYNWRLADDNTTKNLPALFKTMLLANLHRDLF